MAACLAVWRRQRWGPCRAVYCWDDRPTCRSAISRWWRRSATVVAGVGEGTCGLHCVSPAWSSSEQSQLCRCSQARWGGGGVVVTLGPEPSRLLAARVFLSGAGCWGRGGSSALQWRLTGGGSSTVGGDGKINCNLAQNRWTEEWRMKQASFRVQCLGMGLLQ